MSADGSFDATLRAIEGGALDEVIDAFYSRSEYTLDMLAAEVGALAERIGEELPNRFPGAAVRFPHEVVNAILDRRIELTERV